MQCLPIQGITKYIHFIKLPEIKSYDTTSMCLCLQDGREWKHCSACEKCVKPCTEITLQIQSVDRDRGTVSMMTYYPVCLLKYFLLSAWRHCQSCGRCALPDHPCGRAQGQEGCFNCGSLEHKRKVCPLKDTHRVGR